MCIILEVKRLKIFSCIIFSETPIIILPLCCGFLSCKNIFYFLPPSDCFLEYRATDFCH